MGVEDRADGGNAPRVRKTATLLGACHGLGRGLMAVVAALLIMSASTSARSDEVDAAAPSAAGTAAPQSCPDPKVVTGPYQAQIATLNGIIAQKDTVIQTLQGDVKKKSADITILEKTVSERTNANNQLLGTLGALNTERGALVRQISEKTAEVRGTRDKFEAASKRASEKGAEQAKFQTEADALKKQLDESERALAASQSSLLAKSEEASGLTTRLKDANDSQAAATNALNAKQLELARRDAFWATVVVLGIVALPVIILALYLLILRERSEKAITADDGARIKEAARGLRTCQGRLDDLFWTEDMLLNDMIRNRALLTNAHTALRLGVVLSLGSCIVLTFAALWYVRDVSLAAEKVELVKSGAWQALVALFAPVGTLIGVVTLAHTKYKDSVAHCLAAQLCHWSAASQAPTDEPAAQQAVPAMEKADAASAAGIDIVAASSPPDPPVRR